MPSKRCFRIGQRLVIDMKNAQPTAEAWKEKVHGKLAKMRLIDDLFFRICIFDNIEAAQHIIRVALNDQGLVVEKMIPQEDFPQTEFKSSRLDVVAIASDGRTVDIEVQVGHVEDLPQRGRFYLSQLTRRMLAPSQKYRELADAYVVFIVDKDIFHEGRAAYEFDMYCPKINVDGGPMPLGDGGHIIFLNCEYGGDDDYGRLASDMLCEDPHLIKNQFLREAAIAVKEGEKGERSMSDLAKSIYDSGYVNGAEEGAIKGLAEGKTQGKAEVAKALLMTGELSIESISNATGIPVEELMEMKKSLSN